MLSPSECIRANFIDSLWLYQVRLCNTYYTLPPQITKFVIVFWQHNFSLFLFFVFQLSIHFINEQFPHEFLASQTSINDSMCEPDEIRCLKDGRCIKAYHYCNGVEDCIDGSDEDQCPGVWLIVFLYSPYLFLHPPTNDLSQRRSVKLLKKYESETIS